MAMPRTIDALEFNTKCLALVDEVERLVITKNGKPIADLVPRRAKKRSPFGVLKGELEIVGDIMSPIDVEWNAMK